MAKWSDKVLELESRGWSLTGIGREIGLSVQAVSDIKQERTRSPRGMAAVLLHNLHSTGRLPGEMKEAA